MEAKYGKFLNQSKAIPVHVKYKGFWRNHDSLAHMWNDWYREYLDAKSFFRIVVRFEDLLFHARNVTTQVCKCAGGALRMDGSFRYVLESAKRGPNAHGPMEARTGFLKALTKYGKAVHRLDGFRKTDIAYAREHLDPTMMDFFRYVHPSEDDVEQ